ncbi:MAG: SH3 domain-containing protein [Synechococcales bacterium]|nr:SH3 domain-containing protein [Synechococcales bacterium]
MQTPSGRLNNRYEVIRELGDGGFGKTFLVRDHQMPSVRQCVVKQLKPLHSEPQIYEIVKDRFQREAAILEKLGEHEYIPRLYAYFSEADLFYLVEEYIAGDTLTQRVQHQGCQDEQTVRLLLLNLLPTIAYVHQQQIVHRDIKPDNIILRQTDQKPILIDFGAVKETMGTLINSQGKSAHSIVVGTPGFMPAEQLAGRPVYASDIYSLGLTAIYLLTGKIPQELPTDPMTGAIQWRSYAPQVSSGFAALIDHTLHLNPQQRFTTAPEMLAALNALDQSAVPLQGAPYLQTPHQPTPSVPHIPTPPPIGASGLPTQAVSPGFPSGAGSQELQSTQPVVTQPPLTTPGMPVPASTPSGQPVVIPSGGSSWKTAAIVGGIAGMTLLAGGLLARSYFGGSQPTSVVKSSPSAIASMPAQPKSTSEEKTTTPAEKSPKTSATAEPDRPSATDLTVDTTGTDATVVGKEGEKNVRSGPGTNYSVMNQIQTGDRVKVLATSRGEGGYLWHKVYVPKRKTEGWVADQLLTMDDEDSAVADGSGAQTAPPSNSLPPEKRTSEDPQGKDKPAAPAEETPMDNHPDDNGDPTNATIVGAKGSKNIRVGPGTSYQSVHDAYPGDRVTILESAQDQGGFTWYKVYFPKSGAEGWIAGQLLELD